MNWKNRIRKIIIPLLLAAMIIPIFNGGLTPVSALESGGSGKETDLTEQTLKASLYTDGSYGTLSQDASVISLTGKLPTGAEVKAYPVTVGIDGVNVLAAYDITIFKTDGSEFEPTNGAVQVKISTETVRQAVAGNQDLSVYHMQSANNTPQEITDIQTDQNSVTFEAASFSVYVVGGHYTHTYKFYNGNALVNTQILSTGETLNEPETPTQDHAAFTGWYTAADGGKQFTAFSQEGALTADATTNLYARFSSVYYVYFMSDADGSKVIDTKTYTDGNAAITTDDVPFVTDDVNKALVGWTSTKGGTTADTALKLSGSDLTLYPVVKDAHWITYESNGGTDVSPAYVLTGNKTVSPADPTRTGYTFGGWYTDAGLTQAFTFGSALDANITLYAKWTAATTSYTVVYWRENVTEDTYSYSTFEQVSNVNTGALVSGTESYDWSTDADKAYFHFDHADQNVTVVGDGSTIVNVYYKRNTYTIEFDLSNENASININDKTYTGSNYSFTARLGEDISAEWPSGSQILTSQGDVFWGWSGGNLGNTKQVSKVFNLETKYIQDATNKSTTTYTAIYANYGTVNLHYMLQNADDEGYTESQQYYQKNVVSSGNWSGKAIAGFTYSYKTSNEEWNETEHVTNYYFYYTRNTYNITFFNNGNTDKEVNDVRFDKNIASENYTPTLPSDFPSYYEFKGWYMTPQCYEASKFDFTGAKMPANNLALYAKWEPKNVTVTFNTNGGTSIDPVTLPAGQSVTQPADPTRDGYDFAGWRLGTQPYNFSAVVTDNITLTAQWVSKGAGYTITYDPNGGTGSQVKDSNKYAAGSSSAELLNMPSEWTAPSTSVGFVCWNTAANGTGTSYYPGDELTMGAANVVLYAQWAPIRKTTLTYNFNYKSAPNSVTVDVATPNATYAIAEADPTRAGYKFLGWTIDQAGTNPATKLQKGNNIQVDTIDSENNVLYAQWVKVINVSVEKIVSGNMGEYGKSFHFTWTCGDKNGEFSLTNGSIDKSAGLQAIEAGKTVTITEDDYTADGYTSPIITTTTNEGTGTGRVWTYTVTEDSNDVQVVFTNERQVVPPSGIVSENTPYVLMTGIVLAAGAWFVWDRRRRNRKAA